MDLSGQIIKDIKVLYRDKENLQKSKEQKGEQKTPYIFVNVCCVEVCLKEMQHLLKIINMEIVVVNLYSMI